MDCSCSSSQPSNSKDGGGGAAKYLSDLPSRGLLSSTIVSANPGVRERTAEKPLDDKASKRAMSCSQLQVFEQSVGSQSREPDNLHSLTVERLRALLKEKGLPVKGKKDELITRLRAANG